MNIRTVLRMWQRDELVALRACQISGWRRWLIAWAGYLLTHDIAGCTKYTVYHYMRVLYEGISSLPVSAIY
jgi:hypothetical protein